MAGLNLYQCEDLRDAVKGLAKALEQQNLGLLEKPWLVVPSAGIRQWLDGELSASLGASEGASDGVTANLIYFFPEQLVGEIERTVLQSIGKARLNWSKEMLAMRIFGQGVVSDFSHAQKMAEIIDNLNRWRPEVLTTNDSDEHVEIRKVYQSLANYGLLPHEQRQLVLETLASTSVTGLPSTVALLGLSNMPGGRQFGELLAALSAQSAVYVFQPVSTLEKIDEKPRFLPSRWNAEIGEAKSLYGELAADLGLTITSIPRTERTSTTLENLQLSLKTGEFSTHQSSDDSVKFIGAYGNSRQVEVLRNELLSILNNDKLAIEPHEILVLTPDLSGFGPLLERHWMYERQEVGAPRLPIDYAERPDGHISTRLDASFELLKLIGTRVTVEQLSRFVSIPSVGYAIGLEAEEQDRIWALASENKVMAGTSNQQRAGFKLMPAMTNSGVPLNVGTWERFIDGLVKTYVLPANAKSDIQGIGTIDDARKMASLLPLLQLLEQESSLRTENVRLELIEWLDRLEAWVSEVLPATDTDRSFERQLLKFRELATELNTSVPVSIGEFTTLWRGTSTNSTKPNVFGRGGVVVSGFSALPNVPFKVIALVGFDEANLPGPSANEGLTGDRRVGEPSPRQSILQAFAQAIMSAQERLIITYNANNEESGVAIDPAIPLEELIEAVGTLTENKVKPVATSRHEFFLAPSQDQGFTSDPRVGDLVGIDSSKESALQDFSNYLDPERAKSHEVSVKDFTDFYANPQRFFLRSIAGVQIPSSWPEVTSGATFEWSRWTTSEISQSLIQAVRKYLREHPEIDSVVHMITDEEKIEKSLVKRNQKIAEEFDAFYESLLEDLEIDTAKTGAIPRAVWRMAIDRDEIVYEALLIEAEFERFEEVPSPMVRNFQVGSWTVDASSELGDRDESVLKLFREKLTGELKLITYGKKGDRYKPDKKGPLTKTQFQILLGLTLLRASGVPGVKAEIWYREEFSIFKNGLPRGMGIVPIEAPFDSEGAKRLLLEMLEPYDQVRTRPVPLFPKTTFAVASGESGIGAWEGGFEKVGERERSENLVLYPFGYQDLMEVVTGPGQAAPHAELPYVEELRRWSGEFVIAEITSGKSDLSPRIRAGIERATSEVR